MELALETCDVHKDCAQVLLGLQPCAPLRLLGCCCHTST